MKPSRRARKMAADIAANVDAMYAKSISYDLFATRNRAIWDAAHAAGIGDEVNAVIRSQEKKPPRRDVTAQINQRVRA